MAIHRDAGSELVAAAAVGFIIGQRAAAAPAGPAPLPAITARQSQQALRLKALADTHQPSKPQWPEDPAARWPSVARMRARYAKKPPHR